MKKIITSCCLGIGLLLFMGNGCDSDEKKSHEGSEHKEGSAPKTNQPPAGSEGSEKKPEGSKPKSY